MKTKTLYEDDNIIITLQHKNNPINQGIYTPKRIDELEIDWLVKNRTVVDLKASIAIFKDKFQSLLEDSNDTGKVFKLHVVKTALARHSAAYEIKKKQKTN